LTSSEPQPATRANRIVILWDTFGPQHVDRMNDVAVKYPNVLGLELYAQSHEYDWSWTPEERYEKLTLKKARKSPVLEGFGVIGAALKLRFTRGFDTWFMCHYERPYILASSWLLRLTGARVYVMQDSRFEDKPRHAFGEWLKSFFYSPYNGAVSATSGTTSYLRFLGLKGPIAEGYDTGSVARISSYLPKEEIAFADRPFLFVARLLEQKNPTGFVRAYAAYVRKAGAMARPLVMVGSGPEDREVRRLATEAGVIDRITFVPWANQPDVVAQMARALYLCLPSVMEPFGNVVGEAACVGLPALLSDVCGARDLITRDFVSGFVLPVDDVETWSEAMLMVSQDEALWRRLRAGAFAMAPRFDSARFVDAIDQLTGT
jgi:L-malate glycosyltransferase